MVTLEVMEEEKKKDDLRVCRKCGEAKDLSQFGVNRRYSDGLQRDCKPCTQAASGDRSSYLKEWRAQNLEGARKGSSQSYRVRAAARKRYYEEYGDEPLSREAHEEACRKYIIQFRAAEKTRRRALEDELRSNELASLGSKMCKGCGESKPLSMFSSDRTTRGGMQGCCKSCVKAYNQRYYRENREKLLVQTREWTVSHKEKVAAYLREYRRVDDPRRWREDVQYKLRHSLRTRLQGALKNNAKTGSAVRDLGCTIPELKAHLEQQFQPGMSWGNWGNGPGEWSIDHIKCLAGFDLRDPEQLKEACNFRNLRPLWHIENISRPRPYRSKTPKAEAA